MISAMGYGIQGQGQLQLCDDLYQRGGGFNAA